MKKKTIFLILLLSFIFPFNTKAICYNSEKTRLYSIANNIHYVYVFDENTKTFNITFTNLSDKLTLNGNLYSQEVTLTGFNPGQNYKFELNSVDGLCQDTIKTFYINLPIYNENYNSPLCNNLKDYKICQKWGTYIKNQDKFKEEINKIKSNSKESIKKEEEYQEIFDYLALIFVKTYYIVLPIIIVFGLFGIYKLNKKDRIF